jgi:hypothetical protein
VRVRQPLQQWVWDTQRSAEIGAFQRRSDVRRVLHHLLRHQQDQVVQARYVRHNLGHQLLPAQLLAPQQQWRLVQPAAPPLRHVTACVDEHRRLPSWHRPGEIHEVKILHGSRRHKQMYMYDKTSQLSNIIYIHALMHVRHIM